MEITKLVAYVGLFLCLICIILINYKIKYKGKCILHDWEYIYNTGDYWKYSDRPYGRFLKKKERYECRKCGKEKKYKI